MRSARWALNAALLACVALAAAVVLAGCPDPFSSPLLEEIE